MAVGRCDGMFLFSIIAKALKVKAIINELLTEITDFCMSETKGPSVE